MSTHNDHESKPTAVILSFPRRRGRPRSAVRNSDTGTPELIMKRLLGETAETLDLCLERGIITREQHWCGIHLRWLYTLRHGAPSIRAVDPTHLGGIESKPDDPEWRAAREKEYHDAMKKITHSGHAQALMNICVYNERPRFLSLNRPVTQKRHLEISASLENLRDGFEVLVKHWKREGRKK